MVISAIRDAGEEDVVHCRYCDWYLNPWAGNIAGLGFSCVLSWVAILFGKQTYSKVCLIDICRRHEEMMVLLRFRPQSLIYLFYLFILVVFFQFFYLSCIVLVYYIIGRFNIPVMKYCSSWFQSYVTRVNRVGKKVFSIKKNIYLI